MIYITNFGLSLQTFMIDKDNILVVEKMRAF